VILLAKIALGGALTVAAGTALLTSEGFINVNVVEKDPRGRHIHVIAPALLISIAVRLVPNHQLADGAKQLRPWLPTVHAALQGLRDSPDLTLVEVRDPDDHVHVAKDGGNLVVDVDSPDVTVHVSVPWRAINGAVQAVADRDPDRQACDMRSAGRPTTSRF
jgi:hypothetical protein